MVLLSVTVGRETASGFKAPFLTANLIPVNTLLIQKESMYNPAIGSLYIMEIIQQGFSLYILS